MAKTKIQIPDDLWAMKNSNGYCVEPVSEFVEKQNFSSFYKKPNYEIVLNFKDEKDKRRPHTKEVERASYYPYLFFENNRNFAHPEQDIPHCDLTFNQTPASTTCLNIKHNRDFDEKTNFPASNSFNFNGCFGNIELNPVFPFKHLNFKFNNKAFPKPAEQSYLTPKHIVKIWNRNTETITIDKSLYKLEVDALRARKLKKLALTNHNYIDLSGYSFSLPNLQTLDLTGCHFLSLSSSPGFSSLDLDLLNDDRDFDEKRNWQDILNDYNSLCSVINPNAEIIMDPKMWFNWSKLPYNKTKNTYFKFEEDSYPRPIWQIKDLWSDYIAKDGKVHITPLQILKYTFSLQKDYMETESKKVDDVFAKWKEKYDVQKHQERKVK